MERPSNHACPVANRPLPLFALGSAQKNLFMQNKPNFPNAQMNVSSVLTMDYVNIRLRRRFKNKANSKPIKPNFNPDAPKTNPIKPNSKSTPLVAAKPLAKTDRSSSTILIFIILFFFVLLTVFQRL